MPKLILSYICGSCLALLIVHPWIDYTIPLMVNSSHWCYLVAASGLLGFALWQTRIPALLKILSVYLFANCFFSQTPYLSFNAYILVAVSFYAFLFFQYCNLKPILQLVEAAFWFELFFCVMQLLGRDKLFNFDRPEPVMFGTVMQYMRFGSLLAVMAPFVILKNKWNLIPIVIATVFLKSSTLMLSLAAGLFVFGFLKLRAIKLRFSLIALTFLSIGGYALLDWGSWDGAVDPANGGRLISWIAVLKTWCFDLSRAQPASIFNMNGPFNWQWFLFGHGMDTFLPLFPIYKHDMNPFPQAHNSWFQFLWEIGLVGFTLIAGYCAKVIAKLFKKERYALIGGITCIGTDMFFAFPDRLMQSAFLMLAYFAYCAKIAELK